MKRLVPKHPRAIRWLHWLNVPLLAVMIWSGLLIYWANRVYSIDIGDITLIKFFPEWFFQFFHLEQRLAEGLAWHFTFMWLFAINGLAYVLYTAFSGEWRYLLPDRHSFREAWQVLLHDLHLSKIEPPKRKFNGAQQIAYTGVILMGAGSLATGLAIYKPVQIAWLTWLLGGYEAARLEHFALTIGYVLFFVVHIVQVIRAGWNNFRAMITGYEVEEVPEIAVPAAGQENARSDVDCELAGITRRSALTGGMATAFGLGGLYWLVRIAPQKFIPLPLRRMLEFNERVSHVFFKPTRLAPLFPRSDATMPRVNGNYGRMAPTDVAGWKLLVKSQAAGFKPLELSLDDVKALPRIEMVTELKCIEGWSNVVHWAGARLVDFARQYQLATRDGQPFDEKQDAGNRLSFVDLKTPDGKYFVGLDMASALHPQTLLCYEMDGKPLTIEHGAPLRLVIPVKYGIKHLKWIGTIEFTDQQPRDFWGEYGYDWYSGH